VRLRSLLRGLRGRLWALLAVAVAVALSAAFAALVATAWSASLPTGARADLAASADDDIVISKPLVSVQDDTATTQTVDQAVAQDAPGVFTVEHTITSESYTLPGSTATAPLETYAVAEPSVMAHAQLTAGSWPSAATVAGPHGPEVPVAVPGVTAEQLGLRVGGSLTVGRSPTDPGVDFLVVGEFRYLGTGPDQAALAWNTIGPSGITYADSPAVTYGPLAVASAALTDGALVPGSGNWTLIPADAPSLGVLQHAVQAVATDQRLAPWKSFQMTTPLTGELALVSARVTAGRAELLAAGLLCGLLAGLALGAAAGNLVARGAAQAALMRSRGAPAWKLAAVYLPDTILVLLAAALGVLAQAPLAGSTWLRITSVTPGTSVVGALGRSPSPEDWAAGLAVACAAAGAVLLRAVRVPAPGELAAAAGRQSAVSNLARTGADLALVALAGAAVWQASNTGLVAAGTGGGTGVVLIVACAPALATAAGAALCGRLVALGARVGERAAGRARSLPARLAVWELARTPLRHLLPALLSVAAVAGCGYAAAQHDSWQRSVHDQAAFQVGADVSVSLAQPQALDPAAAPAGAPGTLAATPVYTSTPAQGPMIVGLDARSAPQTVDLRADQADRPLPALWSAITPAAEPGFALPGRPIALGIEARLAMPGLVGTGVTMTVEDASGIAYQVDLGDLPADAATHTLQAVLAPSATGIDYPLRIIGVALDYQLPAAVDGGSFTVAAVTARDGGQQTAAPVAGAAAAIASWTAAIDWNPAAESLNATEPAVVQWKAEAGHGAVADFSSGAGGGPGTATTALAITAGDSGEPLPAIATQAFLTAGDEKVGAVVDVDVGQISIPVRIVAAVRAFPAVTGASGQALIVDLGELSDQAALNYDPLGPVMTWWLRTADGATPPVLPVAAVAENAVQVQAGLVNDPLAAVPQRVLTLGAVALVLLALLGLLISLLAAARAAAARDSVLSALGMTRPQRAALGVVLHTCVAAPAAVLGVGLGFALAWLLVPVFVLSPEANRPQPPPIVLFAAPWSLAAAAIVTGCTALAALAGSAARRNPSAASRTGD
jgi:hypothetical protein